MRIEDRVKERRKRRKRLTAIAGTTISLCAIGWVVYSVESETLFTRISEAQPIYLLAAVVVTVFSYILRAYRWPYFFAENCLRLGDSYRCLIVGFFMNNILPARAGELVRAHLGGRAVNRSRATVLATVAGERLADGVTISALFGVLFSLGASAAERTQGEELFYVSYLFAAVAAFVTAFILCRNYFFAALALIGQRFNGDVSSYTLSRIQHFVEGLEPMFRRDKLLVLMPLSIVVWCVELLAYYFVAQAYGQEMTIGGLALFLAAVNFSSLVPSAPAGVGVIEAFATAALVHIGIERETALAMVASQHLIQFMVVGVPGALLFMRQRAENIDLTELASELDDEEQGPTLPISEQEAVERPDVSIVIPAYNEESRLPVTLASIFEYFQKAPRSFEIIVVDDGSRDKTAEVVKEMGRSHPELHLISYLPNRGKGYACRVGMLAAKGRTLLLNDADGATPIAELERLQRKIDEGADLAIGSRAMFSKDTQVKTVWYRKFMGRIFNTIVNLCIVPGIRDTQCGFKLFKRDVGRYLFSLQTAERFSFDVEILFLSNRLDLEIAEVPVNWTNVPGSKVNLAKDSAQMFLDIFRFRLKALFGVYDKDLV